jgi:hypothetical protein
MTLANMRKNGGRSVLATCEACAHKADVNVDALPETTFVPKRGGGFDAPCAAGSGSTRAPDSTRLATAGDETGPGLQWRSIDHRELDAVAQRERVGLKVLL